MKPKRSFFIRRWTPFPECGEMWASSSSHFSFLEADGVPSGPMPVGTGISGEEVTGENVRSGADGAE